MNTSTPKRCPWCGDDPLYVRYHDEEWGVPVHDDRRLFEFLVLEGFQAGLTLGFGGGVGLPQRGLLTDGGGKLVGGATLREVGTTNITRIADYERAIGPNTAALRPYSLSLAQATASSTPFTRTMAFTGPKVSSL